MNRVILVHGWGGNPHGGWFSWLQHTLEKRGVKVIAPQLPDTNFPEVGKWISALKVAVGKSDSNTYFIGHSLGCQTIMRYIESLSDDEAVGGAIFVAGFYEKLTGLSPEEEPVWKKWHSIPINTERVRAHLPKCATIFSSNDPYVPLANEKFFVDELNAEIIIIKNMGHFAGDDGCGEIPEVLNMLEKMGR